MKKQDKQYINEILEHLGVKKEPAIILRLGDSKKSTRRPIKITMKTKEDKEKVMERCLKGTEEYFGKISVTDDWPCP